MREQTPTLGAEEVPQNVVPDALYRVIRRSPTAHLSRKLLRSSGAKAISVCAVPETTVVPVEDVIVVGWLLMMQYGPAVVVVGLPVVGVTVVVIYGLLGWAGKPDEPALDGNRLINWLHSLVPQAGTT